MNSLNSRAFEGLAQFIVALWFMLFVPVWTLDYWQAWVFFGIFTVSVISITLYLVKNDPKLLERRVNAGVGAEKEKIQKTIQFFASVALILVVIFPPLDHRFGWSELPIEAVFLGDALVILGLYIVFRVFKENTFTSATIEIADDQKVISTGPYATVRHPMYSGALIMLLGVPLALGSLWGLLTIFPMIIVISLRLLDEERFLMKNLSGYSDYKVKVRSRLVPFIW